MKILSIGTDFEETAIPHKGLLYNYALHLTMNSENAKDLVQETYLKAYKFWNQYEQGTNIKGWLFQIMKNSYINHYRRKIREPRNVEYNENQFCYNVNQDEQPYLKDIHDKSCDEIFEDEIAHSITSLPPDFMTVVFLSDVEDYTYDEIANMLACPVGTVRSRLHRGRKQLQKKLFNYAKENGYIFKGSRI